MSLENNGDMTFWDHLTELFRRFRNIFYAFIVSTIFVMVVPVSIDFTHFDLSTVFYQTITSTLINNFQERFLAEGITLIPINFWSPLEVYIFISIILGATVSLPVTLYQLYKFFSPALHREEKSFTWKFIASFIVLFIFGSALGYLYIVPLTFHTMVTFSSLLNLTQIYDFAAFFSMVGMLLFVSGLIFTFPIYIYLLVKAGILKTQQLTKNRKYLYGGLLIIIALVDPDPGLITELVTFLPLVILMEISIIISKRVETRLKNN